MPGQAEKKPHQTPCQYKAQTCYLQNTEVPFHVQPSFEMGLFGFFKRRKFSAIERPEKGCALTAENRNGLHCSQLAWKHQETATQGCPKQVVTLAPERATSVWTSGQTFSTTGSHGNKKHRQRVTLYDITPTEHPQEGSVLTTSRPRFHCRQFKGLPTLWNQWSPSGERKL